MNKEELQKEMEELDEKMVTEEIEETENLEETAEEIETEEPDSSKQPVKKNVRKKVDKSKERIDELEDKVKRQLAEFENFRKRTELEKTARFDMGAKSVLERILPIVDNFERGLQCVPENENNSFVDGMDKIYKQLMSELDAICVAPIPAVGEEFDPEVHNAVLQIESDEYETGVIAQELLKGYKYKGSVIRHSMVAVAK